MKAWTARDIHNLKSKGARSWYEIKNKADGSSTETPTQVMLYDEIGGWGVYAQDFVRDIAGISGPLDLHISSEGGEVFEGLAIYAALKQRGGVTAYVDSLAASIASVIAMGADKVVMAKNATLMVHDASGLAIGNAKDMRELADLLDKTSDNIASIYAEKTGGDIAAWRAVMQATTWYSAQEAVDAGLADQVYGEDAPAKKTPPKAQAAVQPIVNAEEPVAAQTPQVVMPTPEPAPVDNASTGDSFAFDPDEFRRAMAAAAADALEGVQL